MRLPRSLAASLVLTSVQLVALAAHGQTVTVPSNYTWMPDHGERPLEWINRADCLAKATIEFNTTVVTESGAFELWAGTGCTTDANRIESAAKCFKVAQPDVNAMSVTVKVQDLLQTPAAGVGPDTGTDAVCDAPSNEYGGIDRHLYFLLISSDDTVLNAQAPDFTFKYDITPPPAPTSPTAGPGESSLIVSFTPGTANDAAGYRFYCSEVGPPPAEGAGGAGDELPAQTGDCTSSVLVPGADPPADSYCGETTADVATSGTADKGIANGTRYAVGVAAEDEFGNVGKLSTLACSTPKEVTGYFEAYRAAGGQGGGGFCGFAPARRAGWALMLALLAGLGLWRRRR